MRDALITLAIIGTFVVAARAIRDRPEPAEPWTPELPHTAAELDQTPILIDYRPGCPCVHCDSVRAHPSQIVYRSLGNTRADRPELGGE